MQLRFILSVLALATLSAADSYAQNPSKPVPEAAPAAPVKPAVFTMVDQMPEFIGDLNQFLNRNLLYPEDARDSSIQGRVFVRITIDELGQVIDPVIVRGVYPSIDAEALRVIKLMPPWKPGKQNGQPVRVLYTIPITFKLS